MYGLIILYLHLKHEKEVCLTPQSLLPAPFQDNLVEYAVMWCSWIKHLYRQQNQQCIDCFNMDWISSFPNRYIYDDIYKHTDKLLNNTTVCKIKLTNFQELSVKVSQSWNKNSCMWKVKAIDLQWCERRGLIIKDAEIRSSETPLYEGKLVYSEIRKRMK